MMQFAVCTYSMGSSIVKICSLRVLLMWSMMAANVVDFPDPVGPVTVPVPVDTQQ